MTETLRDRLVREEGLRLFPYKDIKGIYTIGVGHNIEADPEMFQHLDILKVKGITKLEAYAILDEDIQKATNDLLKHLPWTANLDWPRKSVLIDMVFNMGIGTLLTFTGTLQHIQNGQYQEAANHIKNTPYYRQVGARADNLIRILITGEL